jgi:hypothetical protein
VGLERGPLSFVSTTEELLERKVAASVQKSENTAAGIRHAEHVAPLYPPKLALTSPTSGGRSVGIVCSRTKAMELLFTIITRAQDYHSLAIKTIPNASKLITLF